MSIPNNNNYTGYYTNTNYYQSSENINNIQNNNNINSMNPSNNAHKINVFHELIQYLRIHLFYNFGLLLRLTKI